MDELENPRKRLRSTSPPAPRVEVSAARKSTKEDEDMNELAALKEVLKNDYSLGYLVVKHVSKAQSFSREPIGVEDTREWVQFWKVFGKARELLRERKDQLDDGIPASTGEEWRAYEKLKLILRCGYGSFCVDEVSAKEEIDNVEIAHEILARLAGSCVLNSKHAGALKGRKDSCLSEKSASNSSACLSCACVQVANAEDENSAFRGLYLGSGRAFYGEVDMLLCSPDTVVAGARNFDLPVEGKHTDPRRLSRYRQAIAMAITFAEGMALKEPCADGVLIPSIQVSCERFQCFLYSVRDDVLLSAGWDWSPTSIILLWVILNSRLFQSGRPEVMASTFQAKAEAEGFSWVDFKFWTTRIRRPLEPKYEPQGPEKRPRAVLDIGEWKT